jgi:hypothetical protein
MESATIVVLLFISVWAFLGIFYGLLPMLFKYITKKLEFISSWLEKLHNWIVSRSKNKKMKIVVNENSNEKYIKIFDKINNVFIYYNNDNFFQKINNKFLKIPFDSKILNYQLINETSLFIWKNGVIFSEEHYDYEYILDVADEHKSKWNIDYELTKKFISYCKKNEKVRHYVENL